MSGAGLGSAPSRWPERAAPPVLPDAQVHVWASPLEAAPVAVDRLFTSLSADERERAFRFHFERDRRRFVVARATLRALLGRYLGLPPGEVRFRYGPRGKPALAEGGPGPEGLRFNVSHSADLALLAFARGRELGIDVEKEREVAEAEAIAGQYFSPHERAALLALPAGERQSAFFRCWTRKEAFIKVTGDGLTRPLETFDVTLAPGEPAHLLRVEDDPDATSRFWLEALEPAAGFAAALAVEGPPASVDGWTYPDHAEVSNGF